MAIVWGLDLREIRLSKLKSSYILSREYHLRRSKMLVYQVAIVLCVCTESLGMRALANYVDLRNDIYIKSQRQATLHVEDIITVMSCNVLIGITAATIFGAGFFFDLFWPERYESRSVRWAWKIASVIVSFAALIVAALMTIIATTRSANITTVNSEDAHSYFKAYSKPSWIYKKNPYSIAATAFLWLAVIAIIVSTYIMHKSLIYQEKFGPKSFKSQVKEEATLATSRTNGEHFFIPTLQTEPATVNTNAFHGVAATKR